jgi:hypothetical protein
MSEKNNGVPAFPVAHDGFYKLGMTLRDWFAGQALATVVDGALKLLRATEQMPAADKMAHAAYVLADAMIKERDK